MINTQQKLREILGNPSVLQLVTESLGEFFEYLGCGEQSRAHAEHIYGMLRCSGDFEGIVNRIRAEMGSFGSCNGLSLSMAYSAAEVKRLTDIGKRIEQLLIFEGERKQLKMIHLHCGNGKLVDMMQNAGYPGLIGYDTPLSIGRSVSNRIHRFIGSVVPEADSAFDALISVDSLRFKENVHEVIREMGRLVRPGGIAIVSELVIPPRSVIEQECLFVDDFVDSVIFGRREGPAFGYAESCEEWISRISEDAFEIDSVPMDEIPCVAEDEWLGRHSRMVCAFRRR